MFSPERDREDKETLTHHAKLPNRTKMDRARLAGPSSPAKAVGPRCETAGLLPPVSRSRPPLTGLLETTTLGLAPLSPPVSMLELPRVLCEVGAEMASSEPVWTEGPFAMSSVLGADIPVKAERPLSKEPAVDSPITAQEWLKQTFASLNTVVEEGVQCKVSDQDMEGKAPKASKAKARPLTGFEVVEILAKQRHLGKMQFYHLHTVEDVQIRPYDLRVVPSNKVGTDYHIFSPYAVVHIQDGISTSVQSLAEWYRDAVTWRSLKDIPLFKNFILHKAFTRWRRNVRRAILQHRSNLLQEQLPLAEPQFRDALLQMSRLIEELKEVHWLPQDDSKMYTLVDFQKSLHERNQNSQKFLEKFLLYRSMLLSMVHEDSYSAHRQLQEEVKHCKLNQRSQPLTQQLEHKAALQKRLAHADHTLQRLVNMASLVDSMIVQSLVTIIHREVTSFLDIVLKRKNPGQVSLFQGELRFGASDQLTMFPPLHLFKEVLHGAVLSVADSIMQTFDSDSALTADSGLTSSPLTAMAQGLPSGNSLFTLTPESSASASELQGSDDQTDVAKVDSRPSRVCLENRLVVPWQQPLMVQGQRLRGHYFPLSRKQLKWYLGLSAIVEEVEREQAQIMQEAQEEVQKQCVTFSWLVDIHLFTSNWSSGSLNAMRGWTSLQYEEYIKKVRLWIERVRDLPPCFTTSNKLFTVNFLQIQTNIGPLLNSIEEDLHNLLTEEIKLRSENLISELRSQLDGLRTQPTDFNEFTHFAIMVDRCKKMFEESQPQLEYIHSLQDTLIAHFRIINTEEVALEENMLDTWDQFAFLLKQAEDTVSHRLPSMSETLNRTFEALGKELEDMIANTTSGDYLDPNQNAAQVGSKLKAACRQMNVTAVRLKELSRTSKTLTGVSLDLTFVDVAMQKIETRKEMWELMTVCKSQIQEWMQLLFSKFVVARAQEKVEEWRQQALVLSKASSNQDAVLQGALKIVEEFSQQLPVLAELSSPTLKHKHWRNIYKGMGLLYAPEWNLTVADLMSKKLLDHQKAIRKICRDAKAEADMEQAFRKIQRGWEGAYFQLAKFIFTVWVEDKSQTESSQTKKTAHAGSRARKKSRPEQSCDSGTFTIIGLDVLLSETEDCIMTLSNMLLSPHVSDFRADIENWVHLLQELEELLDFCEMYQSKWIFLSKMFYETSVKDKNIQLLEKFEPVDKAFREIIQAILSDPCVLNIVQPEKLITAAPQFEGKSLRSLIIDGLSTMDMISTELTYQMNTPRKAFPRLCFLSDGEVIKLLSVHPTPMSLLPVVRKCFRGVRWLKLECKRDQSSKQNPANIGTGLELSDNHSLIWVNGIYGTLREYVPLLSPLEPDYNPLAWLDLLEQELHQAMVYQMKACAAAHQMSVLTEQDGDSNKQNIGTLTYGQYEHRMSEGFGGNEECSVVSAVANLVTLSELISQFPLQCLLVSEEAAWCSEVQRCFQKTQRVKWERIKARLALKLQLFCRTIQDGLMESGEKSYKSRHMMASLRALVLLNMKHSRQLSQLMEVKMDFESSFTWQRLMKYHLNIDDCQSRSKPQLGSEERDVSIPSSCYVEVLGKQLAYGYEYVGPENWIMVSTPSTDQAVLGILLALTNFRCGFITGPSMAGKIKIVSGLGQALGQQVVILKCYTDTHPSVIRQMLMGALITGSWLVLESVDSMTQGALSTLGQHLTDIHQSFLTLADKIQSSQCRRTKDKAEGNVDEILRTPDIMEGEMVFTGKPIMARFSYGCTLISSTGYSAKLPDNLRIATRPISLAVPDYNIITEVLFTSQGFMDAVSISRKLVSLLSIAKDSLCLPDAVSGSKTSWVALIKNIIAAASAFLHKSKEQGYRRESIAPEDVPSTTNPSEELEGVVKGHQMSRFNKSAAFMNAIQEEQAVVKGIMSVLIPAISDPKKSSQFRRIFEELFPVVRSLQHFTQLNEDKEQFSLKVALTEELQKTGLYADSGVISSALALYQTLKFSQAVLMLGPTGSGKTTCHQALAVALHNLASKTVDIDEENSTEDETNDTDPEESATNYWYTVNSVILFPNALSDEDILGVSSEHQHTWQDGSFTKVLRDSQRHDLSANPFSKKSKRRSLMRKMKWLVLDGDPLATPGWFDKLTTLGKSQPFLSLSSGEKVWPHREEMRVLAEVTDMSGAAPSAVTQCSLVYFSGKDLWRSVWKAELDILYREHTLEHRTLKMWKCMASDLFSKTLTYMKQNTLTSVMLADNCASRKAVHGSADGLQEIMSFIRILHALIEHIRHGYASSKEAEKEDDPKSCADPLFASTETFAKHMFVVAYIWGFGGHLHPRHWTSFSNLARELLFESRYKVEFPSEGSVFDLCLTEGISKDHGGPSFCKSLQLSQTNVPQYEKHAYMLEMLLDSNKPTILVGEVGSGKTTLCQAILNQGRPHIRVPASPLLNLTVLRRVLGNMRYQQPPVDNQGKTLRQQGLLLYIDDLHEAPCDAYGKQSMALELLRQCISRRGFINNDGYHFKLFRSGAVCYLGTCSLPDKGRNNGHKISQRLTRHFSILALPSLDADVLFSFHSSYLQHWLTDTPSPSRPTDMANCIISATLQLYQSVCKNFCPRTDDKLIQSFSVQDLQKVFQGMFLWNSRGVTRQATPKSFLPGPLLQSSAKPTFSPAVLGSAASVLNITRLWMHECLRTFTDRLQSEEDVQTFIKLLADVSVTHFGKRLEVEPLIEKLDTLKPDSPGLPQTGNAGMKKVWKGKKHQSSDQVEPVEKSLFSSSDSGTCSEEDIGEKQMKKQKKKKRRRHVDRSNKLNDFLEDPLNTKHTLSQITTTPKHLKASFWRRTHKTAGNPQGQVNHGIDADASASAVPYEPICPVELLKDMEATIQSVVFGPELQGHNSKRNSAYQERDLNILAPQLALIVKTKEEDEIDFDKDWSCTARYAVHKSRVRQLCHILRALLIPGGHAALFCTAKGTGRKTTVRLAALLTGFKLFEVNVENEFRFREMLKDAGNLTSVQGARVVLLVHENVSQVVMDEVLMVMSSGTVPDLYSEEEQKNLIQKITSLSSSRNRLRDDQALDKLFRNVQRNLHVVLLLSSNKDGGDKSTEEAFVQAAHTRKALSLCHCVELYSPWTTQALVEVACQQLKNYPQNGDSEVDRGLNQLIITNISWAMACMHQLAVRHAANYVPDLQPFTSRTYLELIAHFFKLCSHLRNQCQGHANRMDTILSRVKDIAHTAEQSRQDVVRLKEKMNRLMKRQSLLLRALEAERAVINRTRWHCAMEKSRLTQFEEEANHANKEVEDAFNEVSQLYNKAVSNLKNLSQVDLDEIRRYRCPPQGVVMVMDAICMLFNRPRNWDSSKKLLSQSSFFQELEFYDRTCITADQFRKLSSIVRSPDFQLDVVRSKSRACESLCRWVRALHEHVRVIRHIAPQQGQRSQLQRSVEESRARMRDICVQEEASRQRLEELESMLDSNRQDMEDVTAQLRLLDVQEREATNTLREIKFHIDIWNARKQEVEIDKDTVSGDALILAAVITYFGPFGADARMDLLGKWQDLCLHGNITSALRGSETVGLEMPPSLIIPMDKHLPKAFSRALRTEPCLEEWITPSSIVKLLLWGYRGLWAPRWPLLADMQQHEEFRSKCIANKGKAQEESDYDIVVPADHPNLVQKIKHAAEKGLTIMVTDIERLSPSSKCLDFLVRPSGNHAPGFVRHARYTHSKFCLFFSTTLSRRALQKEIHPAILKEVEMIDLSMSSEELRELMSGEILQSENPDLWAQRTNLIWDKQSLQHKLHQEQTFLMEYILQSFTPLHQDPHFLPRVASCHNACQRLELEIQQRTEDLDQQTSSLHDYDFVTDLAMAFYQALQQVSLLSPLYLFPLHGFLVSLRRTLLQKGQPTVSSGSKVTVTTKVSRIVLQLMDQYRPCLFHGHANLLRLLVSVALFWHSEGCTQEEREAFLTGLSECDPPQEPKVSESTRRPSWLLPSVPSDAGQVKATESVASRPVRLPSWIAASVHADLTRLEQIPAFRGLSESLAANSDQWQEYLSFPSSTVIGPIPCPSYAHLSVMQRALLWKTLFPSWLAAVAEDLSACQLGQSPHSAPQVGSSRAPHTGSPEALARYLHKNDGPVIVQLPHLEQGVLASAHPLQWITQMAQIINDKRVMKVISFGSTYDADLVLKALNEGIMKGHWVILNNCHLLEEWDEDVVRRLTQILSATAKGPKVDKASCPLTEIHPLFKVFFITQGDNPLSVPAVVRACAVRLVSDCPWDLKEQLSASLYSVGSWLSTCPVAASALSPSPSHSASHWSKSTEPILRCAILHSVLLQRQAFQHLGQGSRYHWTQADLINLIETHTHLSKHCTNTAAALEYIAGYLVYGGHVSDSADLEAIVGVTRTCLRAPSATWAGGPHTLAQNITSATHLGIQGLDHHVQHMRDTNDPLLLGFGSGLVVEQVRLHSQDLHTLMLLSQRVGLASDTPKHRAAAAAIVDYQEAQIKLKAIQDSLRPNIDGKTISAIGITPSGPLRDVLHMEREKLMEYVTVLLTDMSSSSRLAEYTDQALARLEKKATMLQQYLGEDSAFTVHLSVFRHPQRFLAALIRQTAQDKQRDVSEVCLKYEVLGVSVTPTSHPQSSVCLGGLELHGALWVSRQGAIQDTLSHKPCPLPLVLVRGVVRAEEQAQNQFGAQSTSSSPLPVYNCPLYKDPQEIDGNWRLSDKNIITHIPLPAKLDPVLCAQRRARLSCIL